MKPSLLVAMDNSLQSQRIIQCIEQSGLYDTKHICHDGQSALKYIVEHKPDMAVMGVLLEKLDGLSIAQELTGIDCKTKLILHAQIFNPTILRYSLENGVLGYSKLSSDVQILECLEAVNLGEYYIDTEIYHSHYFATTG